MGPIDEIYPNHSNIVSSSRFSLSSLFQSKVMTRMPSEQQDATDTAKDGDLMPSEQQQRRVLMMI